MIPPGTHLWSPRGSYAHHGITVGWNGPVVHLAGDRPRDVATARVRLGPLAAFAEGNAIYVQPYGRLPFTPSQRVARALSRLGERGYDLAAANCQHFATWVMTGVPSSRQVERVAADVGVTALASAATMAGYGLIQMAGSPHVGAARLMRGLKVVGAPLSLGPVGAVAALSLLPAAAAGPLVRRWYRDDPLAPEWERRARQAARRVATPAAVGTAIGVTGIIAAAGTRGLGAAGIASGLKSIGSIVGGRMVAGTLLTLVSPIAAAALTAWLVYHWVKGAPLRPEMSPVE